tara:strand:+ start:1064 stop:1222 length:159 start_codon:yes stop_codon:yes gene_type:complete
VEGNNQRRALDAVAHLHMAMQHKQEHGRHPPYPSVEGIDFQINPFVQIKTTF